jgi:hypothetical protein
MALFNYEDLKKLSTTLNENNNLDKSLTKIDVIFRSK